MDILEEYLRVKETSDYVLGESNYYDIDNDTIHLSNNDFSNKVTLYILLHEIAHRCQMKCEGGEYTMTPALERDACIRALTALKEIGHITPRVIRLHEKAIKNSQNVT